MALKDINEIKYYLNKCNSKNLTQRQLVEIIKNHEYERLSDETKTKIINEEQMIIKDLIPNPVIIKNNCVDKKITEYILKHLILNNIDDFLRQLGNGFTYVGNEYKIKLEDRYNYIDLLLYNIEFNCYVVIELKVTELKKEHIGQIQLYMNYIDKNLRKINQDKTIGIIICIKDNKYVIEYCSDKRIISRIFKLLN